MTRSCATGGVEPVGQPGQAVPLGQVRAADARRRSRTTMIRPRPARMPTQQWLAWLCLATFASASATVKYARLLGRAGAAGQLGRRRGRPAPWLRAARAAIAAASPRSVRIGGAIPRDRVRSSSRASRVCPSASSTVAGGRPGGRASICCWARPRSTARRTRRCCGPSWMSRSSRRRAVASADAAAAVCACAAARSSASSATCPRSPATPLSIP